MMNSISCIQGVRYLGCQLVSEEKSVFYLDRTQEELYGCLGLLEIRMIMPHDKEYNLNQSRV